MVSQGRSLESFLGKSQSQDCCCTESLKPLKAEASERIADVGNVTQRHLCSSGSLTLAHLYVGFNMGPMRLP